MHLLEKATKIESKRHVIAALEIGVLDDSKWDDVITVVAEKRSMGIATSLDVDGARNGDSDWNNMRRIKL